MNVLRQIWPTWAALAESLGVPRPTAISWGQRGIPPARYGEIMAAARQLGRELTFEQLEKVNEDIRARRGRAA